MAKDKFRRVVHTHDENAKMEFCVERGAGDFPTLIDVSEFLSVCQETADAFCTDAEAEEVMGIVQQALADTRPVEAVPVVHSEWIPTDDGGLFDEKCKRCGCYHHAWEAFGYYCQHCGAKMDGGKHEKRD